jgi:hypothetical protein
VCAASLDASLSLSQIGSDVEGTQLRAKSRCVVTVLAQMDSDGPKEMKALLVHGLLSGGETLCFNLGLPNHSCHF